MDPLGLSDGLSEQEETTLLKGIVVVVSYQTGTKQSWCHIGNGAFGRVWRIQSDLYLS